MMRYGARHRVARQAVTDPLQQRSEMRIGRLRHTNVRVDVPASHVCLLVHRGLHQRPE